jgi:hypothetical protein
MFQHYQKNVYRCMVYLLRDKSFHRPFLSVTCLNVMSSSKHTLAADPAPKGRNMLDHRSNLNIYIKLDYDSWLVISKFITKYLILPNVNAPEIIITSND